MEWKNSAYSESLEKSFHSKSIAILERSWTFSLLRRDQPKQPFNLKKEWQKPTESLLYRICKFQGKWKNSRIAQKEQTITSVRDDQQLVKLTRM